MCPQELGLLEFCTSNLTFEGSYIVVNLIFSLIVCFNNLAAGKFPVFE